MLLHASVGQENDIVGQTRRLAEIVRAHQDLRTIGTDFANDSFDRFGRARVQAGGGFVEQQQARPHGPGARQSQTLALAAGEQAGTVAGAVRQADAGKHMVRPCIPLGGAQALRV